jgi:hypothetical protein
LVVVTVLCSQLRFRGIIGAGKRVSGFFKRGRSNRGIDTAWEKPVAETECRDLTEACGNDSD